VFDRGDNRKDVDPDAGHAANLSIRQELGMVLYASNVLGSRGPRKMKVCVPRVAASTNERLVIRPLSKEEEISTKCKEQDHESLVFLINKPPRWNERKHKKARCLCCF
jgi:tubby-related protein 1